MVNVGEEKRSSEKKGILSKYKVTLIIIGIFALSYLSIAALMGSVTPIHVVASESMVPTLETGDLILVRSISTDSLSVGDIIVFNVPSPYDSVFPSPIIHRIIEKKIEGEAIYYQTKGDNNLTPDIFKVPAGNVIGKYAGIRIPLIGYVFLYLKTPIGWITVFTLLIAWFAYDYLTSKERKKG